MLGQRTVGSAAALATPPDPQSDFAAWVTPHLDVVRRAVHGLVASDAIDDVVQDSLLRAWQRRSTYDPTRGTPRAWLVAIAIGQARRRTGRRDRAHLGLDAVVETLTVSADQDDLDLRAEISRLAARQREVVVLYYYVDLSVNEVARVLGVQPGTVKSALSDARQRLSETVRER